jgi:hypothetical protein
MLKGIAQYFAGVGRAMRVRSGKGLTRGQAVTRQVLILNT